MKEHFKLYVTYGQIAVFDPELPNPFNDWSSQHFAQGFSWRPESVSFSTLDDSGVCTIEVCDTKSIHVSRDAQRAILVPFSVGRSNLLEIASISESKHISLPEGTYTLMFETGYKENVMWGRFVFMQSKSVQAEILRADSTLSPSYPLVMEAHPAVS